MSILPQYFHFYNFDVLSFPLLYILRENVQNFETKKIYYI